VWIVIHHLIIKFNKLGLVQVLHQLKNMKKIQQKLTKSHFDNTITKTQKTKNPKPPKVKLTSYHMLVN
jgi:hypothetical protein